MQDYRKIEIVRGDIVPTAQRMRAEGRQLVMIHGHLDKDKSCVICYDYEVGNCIESYTVTGEETFPTISEIYSTAAEWPERELNELLGVVFEGLDMSQRLFLPQNMLDGQGQIMVTPMPELIKKAKGKKEE